MLTGQFVMWQKSKDFGRVFKRELAVYRRVLADQRTPFAAKMFLGCAIGYLCLPFDLIPDFIPVIGHLDDAVIVPALVYVALRFVPSELVAEHRRQIAQEEKEKATFPAPLFR
jgi:uncharacterized membrane protein YkvA (DUF1232 family)